MEKKKDYLEEAKASLESCDWADAQTCALIAIAERLDTLIAIRQAETGYGPVVEEIKDINDDPFWDKYDAEQGRGRKDDEIPY